MTIEAIDARTTGVLACWHDVEGEPDELTDLFEWYNRQHHIERFDIPGFVRARRYEAVEGAPRIFSRYDTTDPSVLTSAAYTERVDNPTERTRQSMPHYRRMSRTVCRLAARFGRGEGGKLASIRLELEPGAEESLADWIVSEAFPALHPMQGIVGGQLLAADEAATSIGTAEKRLRGGEDDHASLIVLVTGTTVSAVQAASALLAEAGGLSDHGATGDLRAGVYELVFDLSALD
jgi:hypothetical protein